MLSAIVSTLKKICWQWMRWACASSPFSTDSGSAGIEPEQEFNALTAPDARANRTYCNEETQDSYAEWPN